MNVENVYIPAAVFTLWVAIFAAVIATVASALVRHGLDR